VSDRPEDVGLMRERYMNADIDAFAASYGMPPAASPGSMIVNRNWALQVKAELCSKIMTLHQNRKSHVPNNPSTAAGLPVGPVSQAFR